MSDVKINEFTKVLCQDCLRVRDFTQARHNEEELCSCGGSYCGCSDCNKTIISLLDGKRSAKELNCQEDIGWWNPVNGIFVQ